MKHGRMANKRIKQMLHDIGLDDDNQEEMLAEQQQDEPQSSPFDMEDDQK